MAMSSLSAQLAGLSGQALPTSRRKEDAIGRGIAHSTQLGYSAVNASSSKYKPSVLYGDARAASDVPLTTLRENALSALNQLTRLTGSEEFVSRDYIGVLFGKASLSWERRVSQKDEVAHRDRLCKRLLGLLSSVWGEDENSEIINHATSVSQLSSGVTAFASGLHVLEYMLRLYSIHLNVAEALLLCVLPAHETPLFNRVLQLIDLAEMPSYVFLRPFASPGAETLPRGAVSKKAAGDDAVISSLCKIARDVARIHSDEVDASGGGGGSATGPIQPRRGVSRVISFVAAVLVEALDIQTTAVTSAGSAEETTLRILLPYVLGACCGNDSTKGGKDGKPSLSIVCPDYRSLGYVMASALVAKCPAISLEVREVMATACAKGAVEMVNSLGCGKSDNAKARASMEAVEEVTTSVLALLSVLSIGSSTSPEEGTAQSVGATLSRINRSGNCEDRAAIGISLPASTYRPLAKLSHIVPAVLGEIFENQDIDVTAAVVSLFVRSFDNIIPPENMEKVGKKTSKRITARNKKALDLVVGMVTEPSLREMWRDPSNDLTTSVSSHIVSTFASSPEADDTLDSGGSDANFVADCQCILDVLQSVDASGCDAGIAHSVALLKSGKTKMKGHAARRVELLLGKQSPATISESSLENTACDGANSSAIDDEFVRLLPARVALEHPQASVRLTAVKRLLDECEAAASLETNAVVENDRSVGADLAVDTCRSLLRRFVSDDDSGIAAAGAAAIRRLIAEGIASEEDVFADDDAIRYAINGLQRWSVLEDLPSKYTGIALFETDDEDHEQSESSDISNRLYAAPHVDPIEAMCGGLALAGLAASSLLSAIDDEDVHSPQIESEGELLRVLLIYIGAHLDIASDGLGGEECRAACELICEAAASALIHAVAGDEENDSDANILDKATELIFDDDNCLAVLLRTCLNDPANESENINKNFERRYMWACLNSMVHSLDGRSDSDSTFEDDDDNDYGNSTLAQNVLRVVHYILESYGDVCVQQVSLREATVLIGHLVSCLASIINNDPTMIPAAIIDLCSISSSSAYDMVSKPVVLLLFGARDDTAETNLSSVAILMEAACRHGIDEMAAARLIALAIACLSNDNMSSSHGDIGNGFVQALSLLSHSSPTVRESAIGFISKLSSLESKKVPKLCTDASKTILSHKSSLMMDGSGALPNFLAEIVSKSYSSADAREGLLKHCVVAAIGTTAAVEDGFSFGDYLGGGFAACTILDAMREAGEKVFPLAEQWQKAGRPIFDAFLSPDVDSLSDRDADAELYAIKALCETVMVMLKGVTTAKDYEPNVVISTGPTKSGRRARSYSVGVDDDGLTFIEPYPTDMSSALSFLLTAASEHIDEPYIRLVYDVSSRHVLESQTWGERIFPKLPAKDRRAIISSLLVVRSQHSVESASRALVSVHIDASDFCFLLKSESSNDPLAVTCVADAIRGRASVLAGIDVSFQLSTLLFDKLAELSTESFSGMSYDYTRLSLVQALVSLHEEMVSQNVLLPKEKRKSVSSSRKKGGRARSRSQSDAAAEKFTEQATLLVALIGGKGSKIGKEAMRPIHSGRGKTLVLSLLTTLCSQAPGSVVGSLIPALGHILAPSSNDKISASAGQALRAIVPAYCQHATSSGLSYVDLIDAFIDSCHYIERSRSSSHQLAELCTLFADALVSVPMTKGHGEAVASFVGALVASDAFRSAHLSTSNNEDMDVEQADDETMEEDDSRDLVSLSVNVLGRSSTNDQVVASLHIVQYVSRLIEKLSDTKDSSVPSSIEASASTDAASALSYAIDIQHLCSIARVEDDPIKDKQALVLLTNSLLSIVRDLFSYSSSIKMVIKNNGGTALNNICLSLWQELVQLQSNSLRYQFIVFSRAKTNGSLYRLSRDEKEFWESAPGDAEECLDLLQRVLPVPDYLASVTNLLQDDDTDAPLFVRTAELLSERASEVNPYSHEATLFLEVVPELVTILSNSGEAGGEDNDGGPRHHITIKQASLMAIERLAQALCLKTGDERVFKKGTSVLFPAMKQVIALVTSLSNNLVDGISWKSSLDDASLNDAEIQLLSTAALCASTLVAVLRARCLSVLSKLVKPVISSLSSTNAWLSNNLSAEQIRHHKSAKLAQLALLRTLVSVAETLPQFAVPYLGSLFAPSALPSRTLRQDGREDDAVVASMTERLDRALAKRTPARQLIPVASKAVASCLSKKDVIGDWQEACALLSVLKSSVECTARAELTPVVGKLLNSLLLAYTYDESDLGQQKLLSGANETLLALVMKLSEAQLRPLYARIREWRGDIDELEKDDTGATKRYAFWSMSAVLSKELRSIFLPCLSSVLVDAIKELEYASSKLCGNDLFSKNAGGKKRRRLGGGEDDLNPYSLKPLQPILLCLESALKADAYEGGNWIRGDDGQRHTLILEPLGKLLQAKIPSGVPVAASLEEKELTTCTSAYQKLVEGVGTLDYGSVVGCIRALAMAAGDEQMWKPINHALLEACSVDDRPEVRKVGISCLKSIMESIGEEYMVLLPECLPILSELLEDEEEEIAGLARECVTLGEELLGESLEDSLS
mmetsp:Transcript_2575/g.5440  ORF Transcript_2575/g.5440 Transcript_2575/m.5440 type:complete len:2560 (+) Transcript_2575:317-7996(+)